MRTNRADACRKLYRGSFKKAQLVACLAAMVALAVLLPSKLAGYLPEDFSTPRVMLGAMLVYAFALATMMWIPGRAMKKSRSLDDAEAVPTTLQV